MTLYRVKFIMDMEATSPADAAYQVASALADGDPFLGVYDVTDLDTNTQTTETPS